MTELPRVVATAWVEIQDGTKDEPHRYYPRIYGTNTNHARLGFRSIFRERLETTLPGAMDFAVGTEPTPRGSEAMWDPRDVMITNKGFYFPKPTEPARDSAEGGALYRNLLTEVAEGRAGNPVFTDTKRPDGDE